MFISCTALREVWDIPDSGRAILSGYWDPNRGPFRGKVLIQWKNGKIVRLVEQIPDYMHVHSNHSGTIKYAGQATGSDGIFIWDKFSLMPSFVDAHVHLALDGMDFEKSLERWETPSVMEEEIRRRLYRDLSWGIGAIRDGGDRREYGWLAKRRVFEGAWLGPQIVSVREALHKKGSYGRFLGLGINGFESWQEQKKEFFSRGCDQLKIIVTGIISFKQFGIVGAPQWNEDELKAMVNDAHLRGIRVMVHASGSEGIGIAIRAGVDSIEHGYYIAEEQLQQMAERAIAWVPTVAPVGNLLRENQRYAGSEHQVLSRIVDQHLQRIAYAHSQGVRLGLGTDSGAYFAPHGEALYDEIRWFLKAGVPSFETLRLATQGNARLLGLSEFGRLDVGTSLSALQLVNAGMGEWFGEVC